MRYTTIYDPELDIITSKTSDQATLGGLQAMLAAISDNCEGHPDAGILVDHRDLELEGLSVDEIRTLALDLSKFTLQLGSRKCVHMVETELQFGLIRMWMSLGDDKSDLELHLVYDYEEAIGWLTKSANH